MSASGALFPLLWRSKIVGKRSIPGVGAGENALEERLSRIMQRASGIDSS